ncbi:enoyl-CoA hydratase [Caldovatus sediminis]|uniref:Enoyl-CoA hydratase n=1 Tax=Caldovatus sediminis TaxID=2041189 RepID=A0A8J2ZDJ5_9PROT|nr:enoyl-CoA hydratase/isomerase family protein [Caldovatus sediminis]GGG44901.1 enoyl-CoA hydratase [Caldovatus sediminis]
MPYDALPDILAERPHPRVLRLTINRPDRMNALSPAMHRALTEVWREIDADGSVSVVIVTGAGRAFSAGGDLDLVSRMNADFETRIRVWKEARDMVYNMIGCSKPIISAINGAAVGAGIVLALMSDITIAGHSARLIDGHTKLGVASGDHAPIIWPLLCGMAKSKYYLLTCDPLDGREAERIGLVSLCVPDDELQARALETAVRLAEGPQSAIRWTKLALNNWLRQAGPIFEAALAMEFMGFTGPELPEGVAALRERRAPHFPPGSPV